MQNYHEILTKSIADYDGKHCEAINAVPDIYNLLCSLVDNSDIEPIDRTQILSVIGYFVYANDVMNEDILGPIGFIDDVLISVNEEELFHIINHCRLFNLKIFITSSIKINDFKFKLLDLYSRLRSFYYTDIKKPDDEMCKMFLTKLFFDKQIFIKNKEIFDYVFTRINRSYNDIFKFVETIDQLSLEKKRQLTIPLIKEIL